MDLEFGGSVWHASVRTLGGYREEAARRIALRALDGVGDEALGQWEQGGELALHIRRRLSLVEQIEAGLSMRDIRKTQEAMNRVQLLIADVPQVAQFAYAEAIGRV